MVLINETPKQQGDMYVTAYENTASLGATEYVFPELQATLTIFNYGLRNIVAVANGERKIVEPNDSEKFKHVNSVFIEALQGSQRFRLEGRKQVEVLVAGTVDSVARQSVSYLDVNKLDKTIFEKKTGAWVDITEYENLKVLVQGGYDWTPCYVAAKSAGNKVIVFPANTEPYYVQGLEIESNMHIFGKGVESTILKLVNGANKDVIYSKGVYDLVGTGSMNGELNFGVHDLTIDGNRENNTSGRGMNFYGHSYIISHVRIRKCATKGFASEWAYGGTPEPNGSMESTIFDLKVSYCGTEGIDFAGPHDSQFLNCIVNNCNLNGWGAPAVLTRGNGASQFTQCHVWGIENEVAYKLQAPTDLVNCHGEGAKVNLWVLANNCQVQGKFYGFLPGDIGVRIGGEGVNVAGVCLDLQILDCQGGNVEFANEANGRYKIYAFSSTAHTTAKGVLGNLSTTSSLELYSYAPNGGKIIQTPTGTVFELRGTGNFDDSHLKIGTYHIWVDNAGKLRIKNGQPSSTSDGTVVGTQT